MMLELVRKNLGLKVFSLVVAYLVWMNVVGRGQLVRSVRVPVDIATHESLIATDYDPLEVQLKLRGDSSLMDRMDITRLVASIDVAERREPESFAHPLSAREILNLPRGVEVEEFQDPAVEITLARKTEKTVGIRPDVVGDPAEGFQLVEVTTLPLVATVQGPEQTVEDLKELTTERLDIAGRRRSGEATLRLLRPARARHLSFPGGDEVVVRYQIVEQNAPAPLETEVFLPVASLSAEPSRVIVTVECPPSLLPQVRDSLIVRPKQEELPAAGSRIEIEAVFEGLSPAQRRRVTLLSLEPDSVILRATP